MDRRIFEQLEQLERGARVQPHAGHDPYNNSSSEFSAYDRPMYDDERNYIRDDGRSDEFAHQPMVLDSFDERLLRAPDYSSRHAQAALGQARLSLPTARTSNVTQDTSLVPITQQLHDVTSTSQRLDLSRYAFNTAQHEPASSSPFNKPLPSSPAFNASQRRPAPDVHEIYSRPSFQPTRAVDMDMTSHYQPLTVEQLEAEEGDMQMSQLEHKEPLGPNYDAPRMASISNKLHSGTPIVQGISLVSTHSLPDRFRAIFPYPLFNAVQSKTFDSIYKTNDNFVLSAPTGSGKTAVLELAICRLISGFANGSYKIVYQAPTKSLCAERQRDWQAKFGPLDLQCAELTGDTDNAQLHNVQHASIIITTPEKWDSMTRKWKDHQKLMQMVKLFLIDEVHILKEDRGATLEAVVSRMKSIGSDVRFVALSATVPNSEDVAVWLGKDPMNPHVPALRERFGEEFRPVKLKKHVCGYQSNSNDFAFEKTLNTKLPDVITKYSQRKPIMVFCFTRAACVETAKLLSNWWATKGPRERYWGSPRRRIVVGDDDLRDTISSGVAFHHAGLTIQDRNAVEKGYIDGDINVICCTSTLAVGVNLPCHMVIIKNTVTYQNITAGGCKEYSDLEIMQMLGRAGRPQYDDSAVAIIMTRLQRVQHYEKMITGQEVLESCLHRNLIDHLNAEIGLGTVTSASSAKKWISGTFLYVRLKAHPEYYKINGDAPGRNLDERLENICTKGITSLEEHDLVKTSPKLQCTEFGDAMARYYLQFDTMKILLALPPKSKISEILSAVSQAAEFKDIRFRANEKSAYKDLNKNGSIKFPIPVNLDAPAHKVSLIIQSVLGAVELPTEDKKVLIEFNGAKSAIFQHVHRLIRCVIDCQLYLDDAITTRNALMLSRSLGAQVWDDSPLHMKQLDGVGIVSVRKLVGAGFRSIDDIENSEAHQLERALSRNPPYGTQLHEKARDFPRPRISIQMVDEPIIKKGEHVAIKLKAEIGFLNSKIPEYFQRRAVYVCLLAATSDGQTVHFARISAKKLSKGQDVLFSANLTSSNQSIDAYIMCDGIAGTLQHVNLDPKIPRHIFPPPKTAAEMNQQAQLVINAPNTSKQREAAGKKRAIDSESDEFGDDNIDDADLVRAVYEGFNDIDDFDDDDNDNARGQPKQKTQKTGADANADETWEPQLLANGKWACNHKCGNKTTCKHLCCREGLDKKPKPPKSKESKKQMQPAIDPKQTQLDMSVAKKQSLPTPTASRVEQASSASSKKINDSREARDLTRLHNSIKTTTPDVLMLGQKKSKQIASSEAKSGHSRLSFLEAARKVEEEGSSDYGMDTWDSNDLSNIENIFDPPTAPRMSPPGDSNIFAGAEEDMLDVIGADAGESAFSRSLGSGCGYGKTDLPSETDDVNTYDDAWELDRTLLTDYGDIETPTPPREITSKAEMSKREPEQHLFVGCSTDPAAEESNEHLIAASGSIAEETSSRFFSQSKLSQKKRSDGQSAHVREETDDLNRVLPADSFLANVPEGRLEEGAEEARTPSQDELERFFNEEFGTDLFNYIG